MKKVGIKGARTDLHLVSRSDDVNDVNGLIVRGTMTFEDVELEFYIDNKKNYGIIYEYSRKHDTLNLDETSLEE